MSRKSIPLLCYWDGRISHGAQGITYEDANPKAIKVNRGVKHSQLIEKIYNLIGIDCAKYKLKIICRYLANGKYIALQIDNDESVDIMLEMTDEKVINCAELYIEKFVAASEKPATITDPSRYIHLNVRTLDGKETLYRMKPETPVEKLMTAFYERHPNITECKFIYCGCCLEEGRTLSEYHIHDGADIDVVLVLRGD